MTSITQLIDSALANASFANEAAAQAFLNGYSVDDQAALISALYIGRDHIHSSEIQSDYVPKGIAFDRFFTTGNPPNWPEINPSSFARILYEKRTSLPTYYNAFLRCARASDYSLETF